MVYVRGTDGDYFKVDGTRLSEWPSAPDDLLAVAETPDAGTPETVFEPRGPGPRSLELAPANSASSASR
ncbi:hypothetical protein SYV04_41805 [Hyalangium sp. s54d21]|uniref:Uncharacterized protein n=2 Tax=Hyalangium rubrum TaxID=3103134 RepID=A0ABU5HIC6_9BACT|nr:hypothetical protein [Hyalangium sp. s54d21]